MFLPMLLLALATPVSTPAAVPAPAVVPLPMSDTRGLTCADDSSVRDIVIDFTAGRWRESGRKWSKIIAQDDATITLVKQGGGLLSDLRRVEQLDRATLVLSTELHTGLIDEKRAYHCRVVPPFDADREI
ncbi:hypothetical protein LL253_16050 [Sphingobium soli]|uniref:Uncharacterized protein n=1 Tax=Sphingobium soli TaxID=1591116 RepID=A0ABS8H9F9_9SPHN|nr:hypothetical protein [Sphingobium soli]MCC4234191.1 hypothetical protein [Sphingobium soli]